MSKTAGEGRAPSEKKQRVLTTSEQRKAERAARKAEEQAWADRSGPVTIRKKEIR